MKSRPSVAAEFCDAPSSAESGTADAGADFDCESRAVSGECDSAGLADWESEGWRPLDFAASAAGGSSKPSIQADANAPPGSDSTRVSLPVEIGELPSAEWAPVEAFFADGRAAASGCAGAAIAGFVWAADPAGADP
ncbi:MAG: hypothetical protein ACRD5K_01225 [Candidatus Acidiferrales bacterium]